MVTIQEEGKGIEPSGNPGTVFKTVLPPWRYLPVGQFFWLPEPVRKNDLFRILPSIE